MDIKCQLNMYNVFVSNIGTYLTYVKTHVVVSVGRLFVTIYISGLFFGQFKQWER